MFSDPPLGMVTLLGLTEIVNDGFCNRIYTAATTTTTATTTAATRRVFLMVSPLKMVF